MRGGVVVGGVLGEKFALLNIHRAAPVNSASCGRLINFCLRQQLISSRNYNYLFVHIVNTLNNYLLNINFYISIINYRYLISSNCAQVRYLGVAHLGALVGSGALIGTGQFGCAVAIFGVATPTQKKTPRLYLSLLIITCK